MRVLHVIPSVSHRHGGPSVAIRTIEQCLASRGIEVVTATTDDDGPGSRLVVPLGQPVHEDYSTRWYFRKSTEFYTSSLGMLAWLSREVQHFDVVHVHALFSFASSAAAGVARRYGIPYVIRPLGVLNRYGLETRRPLLKRFSLRWIEGPLLRAAAAVHFTSEAERQEALNLGLPMKAEVIPLGVEPCAPGKADRLLERIGGIGDRRRILFLSRIDPKKNLEGVIRALGMLRCQGLQPALLVCGRGDDAYVDGLKALAASEGVANQLVWLGHVDGDLKADALAAAHLFVLPSLSENFGIAAVEALIGGVPCVLGRGVALSQEIEGAGAGRAVDPDATSIAAGIRRILDDEPSRSAMAIKAAAMGRQRYSIDAMGRGLERLYNVICNREDGIASCGSRRDGSYLDGR